MAYRSTISGKVTIGSFWATGRNKLSLTFAFFDDQVPDWSTSICLAEERIEIKRTLSYINKLHYKTNIYWLSYIILVLAGLIIFLYIAIKNELYYLMGIAVPMSLGLWFVSLLFPYHASKRRKKVLRYYNEKSEPYFSFRTYIVSVGKNIHNWLLLGKTLPLLVLFNQLLFYQK